MKGVIPLRWLAPAFCSLILSACGGGGGGGEAAPPTTSPQPEASKQAAITPDNAKALAFAALRLTTYSDGAINTPRYWFSNPWLLQAPAAVRSNGRISIDYTERCFHSGEIHYTGNLAEDTLTGDLQLDYLDCSYVAGASSSGRAKLQISATDNRRLPSTYVFALENYRYQRDTLSITTNASIQVQPGTAGQMQTTSNITLTDDSTGQTAQTKNLVSLYGGPMQYLSPQPAQRSGSIEHSAWGVLHISTPADRPDLIMVKGAKSGTLRVEPMMWAGIRLAIDTNDDELFERFLRIADVDALLRSGEDNTAPQYTPPTGLYAAENAAFQIPLSYVVDDQNDFLSYSVRAISSPAGTTLSPQLQADELISLTTGGPGNYVIELTIDDGRGGVTTQQIAFRVQLPPPQPAVAELNAVLNDGDTLSVDLSAQNPGAGPFSYRVVSGPTGMNIDAQGQLQWQPQLTQLFFPSLDMEARVEVSNEDHAVAVPVSITVKNASVSEPLVRSAIGLTNADGRQQIFVGDFDNDGRQEILASDKQLIYTLELDNGDYRQDWVYPYAERPMDIDQIIPIDLDNDGRYEIVVQRGTHLAVINEAHTGIDRQISIATTDGSVYGKGLQLADLDGDGSPELVMLLSNNNWGWGSGLAKAIVLNPVTLTELWRTPDLSNSTGLAVGNVDGDPALELVFGGGYVFDGATHANQWLYGAQFGTRTITADVDGDGIDEIISLAPGGEAWAFSAVSKTLLWTITGTAGTTLAAAQLDGDAGQELLVGSGSYVNEIRVYDADQTSAVLTDTLTLAGYNGGNTLAHDIDQDGTDEIVRFTSDGSRYNLTIYNVATATTDYQNSETQLLDTAWFGGLALPSGGGADLALFSNAKGRFATIDMNDGELTIAPATHNNNWAQSAEFCLADYDGDNAIEILASSFEYYSGVVFAYDLATQTIEWTRNSNHYYPASTACADLNGDGHADLILNAADRIEAYDVFNQVLLWSATDIYSLGMIGDVAAVDLNGDGALEIIRAGGSQLIAYTPQGPGYTELGRSSVDAYRVKAFLVTDLGDGGTPEIVMAIDGYQWQRDELVVLNADLTQRSRHSIPFEITALAVSPAADGTVLAGTRKPGASGAVNDVSYFIQSISLANGASVWRSPPLLGPVTPRSLHYHPAANGGNGGLVFGTANAMYLTR